MRHHHHEDRGCRGGRREFARGFGSRGFAGPFGGGGPFGADGPMGGHSGGPHGFGRGGRRRRLFDQAELQLLLLALVAEEARHGYELIKAIETLSGGEYAPSPGVVYPALTYMEEQGVIAAAATDGSRKAFEVTEAGRAQLSEQADAVAELRQRLAALADVRARTDPAPVRRAMHSLKTALFDRLSQDGAGRETVLAIAEIIDEAARKIERIEP